MKQTTTRKGYLSVDLRKDKTRKQCLVHILVALLFIPNNQEERDQIDHINGDKKDNEINNLKHTIYTP